MEVIYRVLDRVIFRDKVDELIVHDRCGADKLVNRWVALAFELGDSTFRRLDGFAQACRDAAADVTHGLETGHLVTDGRDTGEQVGLLGA